MDRESGGVEVDANKDDAELFDLRYGRLEIEDAKDGESARNLFCEYLAGDSPDAAAVEGSEGVALLSGVMKFRKITEYAILLSLSAGCESFEQI